MEIIRFMYDNWFDAAATTLTASSEDADFLVSNIQHPWFTRHHRTTSKTSQWIKWNLGSALAVKAFILKNHNFSGGTINIQANASDVWTSPSIDLSLAVTYDPIKKMWDTAQTYQWWRVDLTNATSADSYFKVGRIYSGSWWSPSINFDNIYRKRMIDPSQKTYSTGGQMSANVKQKLKEIVYQFSHVEYPDNETFESIFWDYVGQTVPYWICQDADKEDTTTMYVENIADWEIEHELMDVYWRLAIAIRECA